MRGLYKYNYQLLHFNNSLISILNFSLFFNLIFFLTHFKIGFYSKIFFHPKKNFLEVGKSRSFFDHVLHLKSFLNSFSNSHSNFKKIYFTKLKKSSFKFRKRKNVYFSLVYSSKPFNNLVFIKTFINFIHMYNLISRRLYNIYFLKSSILKLNYKNNILSFFFLNPHYHDFYINDKKIIKKDLIVKLNIYFPLKTKEFIYSLFRNIYPQIFLF